MLEDGVLANRRSNGLTVKQLKDFLNKLPEDTYVVVPHIDHSYREVNRADFTIALRESTGGLTEFHGDDLTPEPEFGMKEYVVIIE